MWSLDGIADFAAEGWFYFTCFAILIGLPSAVVVLVVQVMF